MILTKTVKTKWNSKNKDYYINLGYEFTKMKDELEVFIEHLAKQSKIKIDVKCDCCGEIYNPSFINYNNRKFEYDICSKCMKTYYVGKMISESKCKNSEFSFAEWCINNIDADFIDKYWSSKNKISPYDISYGSNIEVWLKCQCCDYHDDYLISCCQYVRKQNHDTCPQCSKCKDVHALDSFGKYIEDLYGIDFLNTIWHEKNNVSPYKISIYSNKKLWWHCSTGEHADFECDVEHMTERDCLCPDCAQKRRTSFLQDKVEEYLNELFGIENIKHEHQCGLFAINPDTQRKLPYDNEIVPLKLIIETMGKYHYRIDKFTYWAAKQKEITPEQQFQYQQWKDAYKKQYALDHGYEYLEIPYWTEKDESYKTLIDNKIASIISSTPLPKMKPKYRVS